MKKLILFHVCLLGPLVFGQGTAEITQKVYRDDKYSFSLHYPSDWKPVAASGINTRIKLASDYGLGIADFSVIVLTPPELTNMTPAEFANGLVKRPGLARAAVQTGLPGATLLSSGKTYLSNREAFFMKSTGTMRTVDDETDITVYQIATVFEGKSFTLTCRVLKESFEEYFDACKQLASGFVLIPTKIVVPPKRKPTTKAKGRG